MIDLCLKFITAEVAQAALYDGETPKYAAVDMIGAIEGTDGFHANVRHNAEMQELEPYRVYPVTPARVWF